MNRSKMFTSEQIISSSHNAVNHIFQMIPTLENIKEQVGLL